MEKPASTRQLKVGREIQKALAEIIRSKGMAAMGGAMVTVSEVRMSQSLCQHLPFRQTGGGDGPD